MKKLTKAGLIVTALGGVAYAGKKLYDERNQRKAELAMNIVDLFKTLAEKVSGGNVNDRSHNASGLRETLRTHVNPYAEVPAERRHLVRKIMSMLPQDELEDEYSPKDISDLFDSEAGAALLEKLNEATGGNYRLMTDAEFLKVVTHALIDVATPEQQMEIMLGAAEEVLMGDDYEEDYEDDEEYDEDEYDDYDEDEDYDY